MRWILEHLQIVLAVGAAFAYWLNQRKEARQRQEQEPSRPADLPPDADVENAERTRRVQEEIRRKIAERRGVGTPPVAAPAPAERTGVPPVISHPASPGGLREKMEAKLAQARRREAEERLALERQRELEARMRRLEAERIANRRKAAEITASARSESKRMPAADEAAIDARAWLDDLRQPHAMRRAVVLREVLGPPVGLR